MPIVSLALIAAVIVVLAGCLDPTEAYESIDWSILLLIVGMLGLGEALGETGAITLITKHLVDVFGSMGPQILLASVYLFATILTEFITNNAVAVILTPIVIALAESLGISPRPFLVAVMFAASASFATPIGYQTNTYVFGAGGYKFSDFIRIGVPLNLLLFGAACFLIPYFWPFLPK
jgi:di/tricarboxylate transporter